MHSAEQDKREEQDIWLPDEPEDHGSRFADTELPVIDCPICNEPTDSLKRYLFMRWCLFIFVGAFWQTTYYCACPRCMRWTVLRQCMLNAIPANLVMIGIIPWGMILVATSFLQGHSRSIQEALASAQHSEE